MKKLPISLASFILSAFVLAGCAAGSADTETETDPAPGIGTTAEALSTGAGDTGGGGDTVDPGAGTAEKPKFDVESCIINKQLLEGWGANRAKAYCLCRAKGYSDYRCNNTIPFIDL